MFALPPALGSFGPFHQFIVYRVQPSATPGKTDKFPIDHRTASVADAHDPAIWLDCPTAAATAEAFGAGFGVGFVFTESDPFFFVDIDDCAAPAGGWNANATNLLAWFPGAAIEISHSGRGLHIFGKGICPPHKKRAPGNVFELYTERRFVALTANGAMGDAATDHTASLHALVAQYLMPETGDSFADWDAAIAAGRDPRWRGPEDDADLIARALRSSSAAQAFAGRASFAALWDADTAILSTAFPDAVRPYDASRADSALSQHLAFWTGKDVVRIRRLMEQSGLKRAKWEDREDYYLPRTILATIARQIDVLQDKPPEPVAGIPAALADAPIGTPVTRETFLNGPAQIDLFKGCVYVTDRHRVLVPGGHLLDTGRFRAMYGGYSYVITPDNSRVSHNAWEAFTESQLYRSPRADAIRFRPDRPPGEIVEEGGQTTVNIWWPVDTDAAAGDAGRFTRHVAKLLPDPGDYAKLMAYLAAMVQYKHVKFQWAPIIQGMEGNGKTILGRAIAHCVGDRYAHIPNIQDIAEGMKFTAWVERRLFILLEEIYTKEKGSLAEALKPLITNTKIEIQGKGQDQITGDNRANILAMSNHKDAVQITDKTRRWGVFFTAQQTDSDLARDGMDGNYFPDLWDWFEGRAAYAGQPAGKAVINHFLRSYAIPDELNPATKAHRAPETTSTREVKTLSIGAIEQEIQECIDQGLPGFVFPWVSSAALDKLLKAGHSERRIPPNKRREMMQSMGYDWHPALASNAGRVASTVAPDGTKPRLFIKTDHFLVAELKTSADVAARYTKAQTDSVVENAKFG